MAYLFRASLAATQKICIFSFDRSGTVRSFDAFEVQSALTHIHTLDLTSFGKIKFVLIFTFDPVVEISSGRYMYVTEFIRRGES